MQIWYVLWQSQYTKEWMKAYLTELIFAYGINIYLGNHVIKKHSDNLLFMTKGFQTFQILPSVSGIRVLGRWFDQHENNGWSTFGFSAAVNLDLQIASVSNVPSIWRLVVAGRVKPDVSKVQTLVTNNYISVMRLFLSFFWAKVILAKVILPVRI